MVKKGGKKEKETVALQLPAVPEHLLMRLPKRWVTVYFRLMGFSALDGEVRLPQSATIHLVEAKIVAHHGGSITKLSLWRDRIEPNCVIRDFSLTLNDIFKFDDALPRSIAANVMTKKGGGASSSASNMNTSGVVSDAKNQELEDHSVLIYYDYRAHDSDCPLLLRSPRYPKVLDAQLNASDLGATRK
jgi:hypothetical protein